MYILIDDRHEYTPDFLNFVLRRMFNIGVSYLSGKQYKLTAIDQYLDNVVFTGVRKQKAYQIIVAGFRNLEFSKAQSKVIISINDVVKVPQNDKYTLSSICRLIDQGNTELSPFPIFTTIFNYVIDNMAEIYSDYSFGAAL